MKILFVINNFYIEGNGLAASARRTVKALRDAGHEVRILSGPNLNERWQQGLLYAGSMKQYEIGKSEEALEQMFSDAIDSVRRHS